MDNLTTSSAHAKVTVTFKVDNGDLYAALGPRADGMLTHDDVCKPMAVAVREALALLELEGLKLRPDVTSVEVVPAW